MLSYIELNKANLLHNFASFRKLVHPRTKIISVVKGNAYGHGLKEVVTILDSVAEYFAVNSLEELRVVRMVSQKPILVLGYVEKKSLEEAVSLNAILVMYDLERLKILNSLGEKLNKTVTVHLKIDALLGRQGILVEDLEVFLLELKRLSHIKVEAAYAHFANIEDTSDFTHAQKQIDEFEKGLEIIRQDGFENIKRHMSASAAILVYEKDKGINDFVRLGISQYGMYPEEQKTHVHLKDSYGLFSLLPVLRWVSHIAQVKTLPAGHSIGYGLTHITDKETKTAIIPQGYSDGYDRGLSSKGEVLIHGTRCPILGRVMMNMVVVDVSHLENVKAEDQVVLLGQQGNECIKPEEISKIIDSIKYEVTTRISPLLPRIIV